MKTPQQILDYWQSKMPEIMSKVHKEMNDIMKPHIVPCNRETCKDGCMTKSEIVEMLIRCIEKSCTELRIKRVTFDEPVIYIDAIYFIKNLKKELE